MASVHRHSSGRSPYWFASFQGHDGKFKLVSTKQTERAKAMQVALELERVQKLARKGEIVEGQLRKLLSDILEKVTGDRIRNASVEVFLKEWIGGKEATKAAGTVVRYQKTIRLFKLHLGEKVKRPLSSITPRDIQGFLDSRLKAGAAPSTAIVDIKTLNTAFNLARRQGLIQSNPVEAIELPSAESSTRDVFTPGQLQALLSDPPTTEWKTLILLGYYIGARLNDCANMKWENVDLTKNVITYYQKKTRRQKRGDGPVVVPLHPDLQAHLLGIASNDTEIFLCPSLAERTSGGNHGLSESFKRIVVKAGIDTQTVQGLGNKKFSRVTFHSLRHSFNSALANAGISQEVRMKLTGHSTASINTQYTHHELAPLRSAIERLPSVLS